MNGTVRPPKDVIAYAIEIQQKGSGKIEVIETTLVIHSGKMVDIKRGARRIFILYNGEKVGAKVSGSRTKIMADGKKAKRKATKTNMTCIVIYPDAGEEAKNIDCKG